MITYRTARIEDLDALLPLFLEMERHYDGADAIAAEEALPRLRAGLLAASHGALIVAFADRPVGFAALYPMFPGDRLESVWFLKELYVAAGARGTGVGEGLMRAVAKAVRERGGTRLEFTTDAPNAPARRFYARMQAPIVEKVFYRYQGADLKALAEDADRA